MDYLDLVSDLAQTNLEHAEPVRKITAGGDSRCLDERIFGSFIRFLDLNWFVGLQLEFPTSLAQR
jgi:hypothetical protein